MLNRFSVKKKDVSNMLIKKGLLRLSSDKAFTFVSRIPTTFQAVPPRSCFCLNSLLSALVSLILNRSLLIEKLVFGIVRKERHSSLRFCNTRAIIAASVTLQIRFLNGTGWNRQRKRHLHVHRINRNKNLIDRVSWNNGCCILFYLGPRKTDTGNK